MGAFRHREEEKEVEREEEWVRSGNKVVAHIGRPNGTTKTLANHGVAHTHPIILNGIATLTIAYAVPNSTNHLTLFSPCVHHLPAPPSFLSLHHLSATPFPRSTSSRPTLPSFRSPPICPSKSSSSNHPFRRRYLLDFSSPSLMNPANLPCVKDSGNQFVA